MKVLHLTTYEKIGGAARAVQRLHRGLVRQDVQSEVMVQFSGYGESDVSSPQGKIQKAKSYANLILDEIPLIPYRKNTRPLFSPSWLPSAINRKIDTHSPDVVHLHWVCKGFVPIQVISRINKPIVWTLHDSWAFTGGCHIPGDCVRYQISCGNCPVLGSSKENDLSKRLLNRKYQHYKNANLTIVSPSRWLAECAKKSKLFKDLPVHVIPNGLDVNVYAPLEKKTAREIWGLPQDSTLLLFSAVNVTRDPHKGFDLLIQALNDYKSFENSASVQLVVVGACPVKSRPKMPFPTHYVGLQHDDISLKTLYAASDLTIVPSRQESFGQIASESLSCGTPVVAFNGSGLSDIVDHEVNGYLAEKFSTQDLARGVSWVVDGLHNDDSLMLSARGKAVKSFSLEKMSADYNSLYCSLI